VFKRLWNWIIGYQSVDLNIKIEIKDLDKITRVLSEFGKKSDIINKNYSHVIKDVDIENKVEISQEQPKIRKKIENDPINATDAAKIFAAGGIEKAIDKTGKNVVNKSKGKSVDDKISSLKRHNQKKGK